MIWQEKSGALVRMKIKISPSEINTVSIVGDIGWPFNKENLKQSEPIS